MSSQPTPTTQEADTVSFALELMDFAMQHVRMPQVGAPAGSAELHLALRYQTFLEQESQEPGNAHSLIIERYVPSWTDMPDRRLRESMQHDLHWNICLEATLLFVSSHGRPPSSRTGTAREKRVGAWLRDQRVAHKQGTLPERRVAALDERYPLWFYATKRNIDQIEFINDLSLMSQPDGRIPSGMFTMHNVRRLSRIISLNFDGKLDPPVSKALAALKASLSPAGRWEEPQSVSEKVVVPTFSKPFHIPARDRQELLQWIKDNRSIPTPRNSPATVRNTFSEVVKHQPAGYREDELLEVIRSVTGLGVTRYAPSRIDQIALLHEVKEFISARGTVPSERDIPELYTPEHAHALSNAVGENAPASERDLAELIMCARLKYPTPAHLSA